MDDEQRRTILNAIDETEAAVKQIRGQMSGADKQDLEKMRQVLIQMTQSITRLEKELAEIPEQTMFYDSESSEPTLDPEYDKFMQRGKTKPKSAGGYDPLRDKTV